VRDYLLSLIPAVVLAVAVTSAADYAVGLSTGDSPAPALAALLHGNLTEAAARQPFLGLSSILLRLPFVAVAKALGGGMMLEYRLGLFGCAWVVGLVGVVVARRMQASGRQWLFCAALVALMVLNPATLGSRLDGHPEELLGGALCLAAVLAATEDRVVLGGALLGLAVATKEWALIAVVPTFLACQSRRRVLLAVATVVAAPLALTLPLIDPAAFSRSANIIGELRRVYVESWWWPLSVTHTVTVHVIGGQATAQLHLLPLGLSRADVSWLAPAVALPIGWRYWRVQGGRDRLDAIGLLALLLLLRCTLDPSFSTYYVVPFLIASLAWEGLTREGLPVGSLGGMMLLWAGSRFTSFGGAEVCDLVATIGLTAYLALHTLRPARSQSVGATALAPA
jgi:hypothetical protein